MISPVISAVFLVPNRPDLAGGGNDPRLIPFVMPFFIFLVACGWIGETEKKRAHHERLKNNPPSKRELKDGESLIDFLYEDEDEEKM